MSALQERLERTIRTVPDFPKPGILFRDITPVLEDPILCRAITEGFRESLQDTPVDAIAGIESRDARQRRRDGRRRHLVRPRVPERPRRSLAGRRPNR